jgi:hypothetical protein
MESTGDLQSFDVFASVQVGGHRFLCIGKQRLCHRVVKARFCGSDTYLQSAYKQSKGHRGGGRAKRSQLKGTLHSTGPVHQHVRAHQRHIMAPPERSHRWSTSCRHMHMQMALEGSGTYPPMSQHSLSHPPAATSATSLQRSSSAHVCLPELTLVAASYRTIVMPIGGCTDAHPSAGGTMGRCMLQRYEMRHRTEAWAY